MKAATAAAMGLVLVASAACGDDGGDGGDSSSGTTTSVPESAYAPAGWDIIDVATPPPPPLAIEGEPLWGSGPDAPLGSVKAGTFWDDTLVLRGGDDDSGLDRSHLAVVDAASGEARWTLEEFDELPGGDGAELRWPTGSLDQLEPDGLAVVEEGDSWLLVVPYMVDPPGGLKEHGLVGLSGDTGEVVWRTSLAEEQNIHEDILLYWLFTTDGAVVTKVNTTDPNQPDRLVAVDPSDGTILWEQQNEANVRMGIGDTLLVELENEGGTGGSSYLENVTVAGLDAATGETSWDLSGRHPQSQLVLASGDKALVTVPAEADSAAGGVVELLVLEAATGEEVASFGSFAASCAGVRQSLIACQIGVDATLATFNPEDGSAGVSGQPLPEGEMPLGSYGDHVIVGNVQQGNYHIVDRAGAVTGDAPGAPLALSDEYGLFVDNMSGTFTVHEITSG